jgi:hypothetical protein
MEKDKLIGLPLKVEDSELFFLAQENKIGG